MDQPVNQSWGALAVDIPTVFAGFAETQPDNPAILAPGRAPLSFAGLHAQQRYVRDTFREWGIERGDSVAVVLPKGPEMAVAIATLPVSATVVPMAADLSPDNYERLFQRCAARALILPQAAPHAARIAAERLGILQIDLIVRADDPAGAFTLAAPSPPRRLPSRA